MRVYVAIYGQVFCHPCGLEREDIRNVGLQVCRITAFKVLSSPDIWLFTLHVVMGPKRENQGPGRP